MKHKKILLLGNGINRLYGKNSWEDLLNKLVKELRINNHIDFKKQKPPTLLFEEIVLKSKKHEGEIKKIISNLILTKNFFEPINYEYHRKFLELDIQHFLTTNYDYNLEKAIINSNGEKNTLKTETKYNLFRRRKINNKFIWHIHGEAENPQTITLGHEHYAGQLQKMRNYLTIGHPTKSHNKQTLKTTIFHNNKTNDCLRNLEDVVKNNELYSWVDLFLCYDVHIVGLSLDYTEIDLWWLIIYKEKLRKKYNLGETTYYCIKKAECEEIVKLSLLESYGVKVCVIKSIDYENFYKKVIQKISRK